MRARWFRPVVVMFALGLVLGIGSTAAADPQLGTKSPPRALGQLIPGDAVALLYCRSVDDAEACLRELNRAGGGADQPGLDLLERVVRETPVQKRRVHRRRPIAVALSLGGLGRPVQTTVILPLADRKGFEADRPGIPASMTVIVKGSYAGISPLPDYAASKKTPEFAARVLDSPIALRLRPHLVAPILRLLTEAMAGQAKAKNCRGTVPADSSEARCAWLHAAHLAARGVCDGMDALQTVDLGLDSEDGQASVQFVLTPVPGRRGILPSGAQARAATDLARCLPQEYPAVTIWALDFPRLAEIIGPLATATQRVQAQRALFPGHALAAAMQHAGLELLRANRGAIVQAAGPGAEGFTWIAIHGVSDAERLARRHREELLPGLAGRPGFDLTIEPESTLGGVPVYAYRLRLDPDALGGKSGADSAAAARAAALAREAMTQLGTSGELVGRVAGVHDKLFLVGQRDPALLGELLARAQQPSPPVPSWLRAVLASPPDTLCWYARTDVQALLAPLSRLGGLEGLDGELARTLAALAQSPPAPVTLRGTVRRGIYRGELRADVAQLRDLVGGFIKAAAAHTDARGHGSPMEHQP